MNQFELVNQTVQTVIESLMLYTYVTFMYFVCTMLHTFHSELWGVLNNAGIVGAMGYPEWLSVDEYRRVSDVNLYGLIDVTMTFLPLIKRSRGRVVNTSSYGGFLCMPLVISYSVGKYGVESFSDGLRYD